MRRFIQIEIYCTSVICHILCIYTLQIWCTRDPFVDQRKYCFWLAKAKDWIYVYLFLQVIKENNRTTIHDSKQSVCVSHHLMETLVNCNRTMSKFFGMPLLFCRKLKHGHWVVHIPKQMCQSHFSRFADPVRLCNSSPLIHFCPIVFQSSLLPLTRRVGPLSLLLLVSPPSPIGCLALSHFSWSYLTRKWSHC